MCHAHGGVYKSVISNKIGKATCYAHLYITGNFLSFFVLQENAFCNTDIGKGISEPLRELLTSIFVILDILPDPPDGAPVIESITGKTITLSWKKPRRLDPSIGKS